MSKINQLLNSLLVACALAIPAADAHSPLLRSVPENDARLEYAPTEIRLAFQKQVKRVLLRLTGESLDHKLRPTSSAASNEHSLTLPELSAGNYTATWRAIGKDGHVMKGSITFSVQR